MFVYETVSSIDCFKGMTRLKDYLKLSWEKYKSDKSYFSYFEANKFLINSFMAVKCTVGSWEGDIRGDEIYISAVPFTEEESKKILAFKQENKGRSFIVSECQLFPSKAQFKPIELKNLVSSAMMEYFHESFDLAVDLIDKATKGIKNEAAIIDINKLKELIKKHEEECDGDEEQEVVNNKFDLKNYQKL